MPWDPSFTSAALPFLDRLPLRHYCKVCRAVDLWRPPGRTEAPDEAGDSDERHTAQRRSERGQKLHYVLCAVSCTTADAYAAHMRELGTRRSPSCTSGLFSLSPCLGVSPTPEAQTASDLSRAGSSHPSQLTHLSCKFWGLPLTGFSHLPLFTRGAAQCPQDGVFLQPQ